MALSVFLCLNSLLPLSAYGFGSRLCARLGLIPLSGPDRPLDATNRAQLLLQHRRHELLSVAGADRLNATHDPAILPQLEANIAAARGEIASMQNAIYSWRTPGSELYPLTVLFHRKQAELRAMEAAQTAIHAAERLHDLQRQASSKTPEQTISIQTEFMRAQSEFFRASALANQMANNPVHALSHGYLSRLAHLIAQGLEHQSAPNAVAHEAEIIRIRDELDATNKAMAQWKEDDLATINHLLVLLEPGATVPLPVAVSAKDPLPTLPPRLSQLTVQGALDLNDPETRRALKLSPAQLLRGDDLILQAVAAFADAKGFQVIVPFRAAEATKLDNPGHDDTNKFSRSRKYGLWKDVTREHSERPYPGLSSSIGLRARAIYRRPGDPDQVINGHIVDERRGIPVIMDAKGELHPLSNPENLIKLEVAPTLDGHDWVRTDWSELDQWMDAGEGDVYATITLWGLIETGAMARFGKRYEETPTHSRTLSGKLIRRGNPPVYLLIDQQGLKHRLDPKVMAEKGNSYLFLSRSHPRISGPPHLMSKTPHYLTPTDTSFQPSWSPSTAKDPLIRKLQAEIRAEQNSHAVASLRQENPEIEDLFEKYRHEPGTVISTLSGPESEHALAPQGGGRILHLPASIVASLPEGTVLWGVDGIPHRKTAKTDLDEKYGISWWGVREMGFQQAGDAILLMDKGISGVIRRSAYDAYIRDHKTFGRADGQFMTTTREMDWIVKEAKGNPQKIADLLGLGDLNGEELIRIDVPSPWNAHPRVPIPDLSGANHHYVEGGRTAGGINEIIVDPLDRTQTRESIIR